MPGPAFKDYGLCSVKNYPSGTYRWGHGKSFLPIRVNRLDGIVSNAKKAVNFFLRIFFKIRKPPRREPLKIQEPGGFQWTISRV
jgi:hypothetical protein